MPLIDPARLSGSNLRRIQTILGQSVGGLDSR